MDDDVAKVKIVSAIELSGFDIFLVVADVESGTPRAGMQLVVPIGTSAERPLQIHGVGPAVGGDGSRVGLAFEADEWIRLAGLGDKAVADGTVLEVREAST